MDKGAGQDARSGLLDTNPWSIPMTTYAGVDVSLEHLDLALPGQRRTLRFANNAAGIAALVAQLPADVQVILEPTSTYHHSLICALGEAAVAYCCVNPARVRALASVRNLRAKTDPVDARLLLAFGETQHPPPQHAPDAAQEELKALRRHLEWLEQTIQAARNRQGAAARSPWTPPEVRQSLERTIRELEEEARAVQERLHARVVQDERCQQELALLTSIPGIGRETALVLLSELPPVAQCASAKSWVAYSGISPAIQQSGKKQASQLSRVGSARVRRALYLPAVSALRWNPTVRALNTRLLGRSKPGKVRVVAAMNKLLCLAFGVLKTGSPYNPLHPLSAPAP